MACVWSGPGCNVPAHEQLELLPLPLPFPWALGLRSHVGTNISTYAWSDSQLVPIIPDPCARIRGHAEAAWERLAQESPPSIRSRQYGGRVNDSLVF